MTKFSKGNTKASKLTAVLVLEMRMKYALPTKEYTIARLSREYHVSLTTASNVVNGVTWQNVPMPERQEDVDYEAKLSELRARALLDAGFMTMPSEEKKEEKFQDPLKDKLKPYA